MSDPSELHPLTGSESDDESERLSTLWGYRILDSLPEKVFDELAESAAIACGTPYAFISFVDEHRKWVKAAYGIKMCQTERSHSFSHHCIKEGERILEIPDTNFDGRFNENPLVKEEPHIRFCAAAPIMVKEGHILGSLCVADDRSKTLSPEQKRALEILKDRVKDQLELRLSQAKMEEEYEKAVSRKIVESEVDERRRIGQELHDGVVQTLAAARMHVDVLKDENRSEGDRSEACDQLQEMIEQAANEIRGVGHSLMGKKVREKGLQKALEELGDEYAPIQEAPDIETSVHFDETYLDKVEAINLYRVAQEFVQNSTKHSGANKIRVRGGMEEGSLWMTLEDDGEGLDRQCIKKGGGMWNMEQRVHLLGGRCRLNSSPGNGIRLTVDLDLRRKHLNASSRDLLDGKGSHLGDGVEWLGTA